MVREACKANRYSDDDGTRKFLPEDRVRENIWLEALPRCHDLVRLGRRQEHTLAVGCVTLISFGLGMMLVMDSVNTALTDFTPKRAQEPLLPSL